MGFGVWGGLEGARFGKSFEEDTGGEGLGEGGVGTEDVKDVMGGVVTRGDGNRGGVHVEFGFRVVDRRGHGALWRVGGHQSTSEGLARAWRGGNARRSGLQEVKRNSLRSGSEGLMMRVGSTAFLLVVMIVCRQGEIGDEEVELGGGEAGFESVAKDLAEARVPGVVVVKCGSEFVGYG